MRITGLITLIAGIVFLLLPAYSASIPFVHLSSDDGRLVGGLLVALGAIALGISTAGDRT
jgi:hypothetical protein